jgi:hypothetical protein
MTHNQKVDALIQAVKRRNPCDASDAFIMGYLASWLVTISECEDTLDVSTQIKRIQWMIQGN